MLTERPMSDLESIEDPAAVDHPTSAAPRRMVSWVAALAVLVIVVMGVSVAVEQDRPLARQAARQNASHSGATIMTAPPPRVTTP